MQWKIGNSFRLFGEYYYSPDSLSSGIQSYEEANAGARYTIMRPVSIEAGYRYLNLGTATSLSSFNTPVTQKLTVQEVRLGLRYTID